MATVVAVSSVVTPSVVASAAAASSSSSQSCVRVGGLKTVGAFSGKSEWQSKTVKNGSRVSCMLVWNPVDNLKFETLSYLPPLTDEGICKEVDYMLSNKWIPCLEFDHTGIISREYNASPGYYDGRYWTMWKLPMFGCNDAGAVLNEIKLCKEAYPNAYIRILGFDASRQVQVTGFLVQKP